ncbi:Proprionate catabolism activator, Fis family [Tepidanaerobacter acetatoxydans Re1]|uniref:Proprionate catabolism activator, Fis family n=1 Tax=Tepidanaerobacter acetatoxydans (strain DSM 21804 / JCM 16047 / Re1) TaxID=1209989 RepID=F4LWA0_TEPAE|nr:sigma-54-dependent Fis family transcriptional regulator [Tepidanaerobacter acetatoxydans]AEE91698.1 proprionate catabolism activator, Fis family [Tepidanaerobacter acetatoxydans Re1]CCP26459.1 Proprionate catabolism activator, Fis family [Tepidanaerobacter acetatoxydans Re1]
MPYKIAIVAPYVELSDVARHTCDELEVAAKIVVGDLEEGVKAAKKLIDEGAEVIISRGGTATAITRQLDEPVVEIIVSPYDIIRAVASAKRCGDHIGVVGFRNIIYGSKSLEEVLDVKIEELEIKTEADALSVIKKAKQDGIQVIVGDAVSVRYSKKMGLESVLVTSGKESISMALREAQELVAVRRREKAKAEQFKAILDFTYEGIIATDAEGKISLVNPAAEKILGKSKVSLLNQPAGNVLPSLALKRVQEQGKPLLGELHRIGSSMIVHNLVPVITNNETNGIVITFQDAGHLQAVENKVRRELYLKGHVAQHTFEDIITCSPMMKKVINQAKQFAQAEAAVVVTGETGTGKEMLVQSIHNASLRKDGPFVAVNCAAVPENLLESELFGYEEGAFTGARRGGKKGLFELAHNGTIFLDEIGELPLKLQARLLRVLQEKAIIRVGGDRVIPVNVRIIAATHRNLEEDVEKGTFRQDLYYRLNVLRLLLPPLRERKDDIPLLIDRLLEKICSKTNKARPIITDEVLQIFNAYHWPGNVRELENMLERLVVLKGGLQITLEDIDGIKGISEDKMNNKETCGSVHIELKGSMEDMEKEIVRKTLELTGYNKEKTCKKLGISQTTLWRKLKKWDIAK